MVRVSVRSLLLCGVAWSVLPGAALAQGPQPTGVPGIQTSDELIVYGDITHRNRTESTSPVLSYDLEYFQRFEPISAGDALKRVPGASFASDVLEHDALQLRGLPPTYAQVQVNGQNLTGAENDRVFFVDRIPAELIDGIEIIRSPSADMTSEGIAGTANMKLKEAGTITGGWVRGSGFGVEDDELRGAGSVGYGNTLGDTSYLVAADVQQRRNPKRKTTGNYVLEGGKYVLEEADDAYETQSDTRDGTDYALSGDIKTKVGDGTLRLHGFYVFTDRTEKELTKTFEVVDDAGTRRILSTPTEVETQLEKIKQHNLSLAADYTLPIGLNELKVVAGFNLFKNDLKTDEKEGDSTADLEPSLRETTDTLDRDWFGTLAYTHFVNTMLSVKVGVDGRVRTRDYNFTSDNLDDVQFANNVDIEERRTDPYVKATWKLTPKLTVETGLRYEHTDLDVKDPEGTTNNTSDQLNPSLHVKYALTDSTLLRGSVARTVRRPSFDSLTPGWIRDDEEVTSGNAGLKQETAWGVDIGVDQKLGALGVFGINFFNRDIKNKIERTAEDDAPIGFDPGATDIDDFDFYRYRNVGDAQAYGVEVDISTPLTVFGLPNTSIFANYTWLHTELTDPDGFKRAFNGQPDYIYNIGVVHNIPEWNSTFGVTYHKRGDSFEWEGADEVTRLSYQGNLEAFWETRISKSTVVRLTGANLLDLEKVENTYDPTDSDTDREIEREKSGRLIMLTVRQAF